MTGYLENLTLRLAAGAAQLPELQRQRHIQFLLARQSEDGGFSGREGGSDLYYSGFALRTLAILGELKDEVAESAARFLRGRMTGRESIVDFLSLMYSARLLDALCDIDVFATAQSDWRVAVADSLMALRRDDGGFAKGSQGQASSTYHTFLVTICLELLGVDLPDPEGIKRFLRSQRVEEGGFREIRVSKRAGTNPTAAAVATLRLLGAPTEDDGEGAIDFLCEMQNEEGGFRANTRIPIADLLSTFTSLVSLSDLNAAHEIDAQAARDFALSLEGDDGGFLGAAWDEKYDVEYTFYGLGTLSMLTDLPED